MCDRLTVHAQDTRVVQPPQEPAGNPMRLLSVTQFSCHPRTSERTAILWLVAELQGAVINSSFDTEYAV